MTYSTPFPYRLTGRKKCLKTHLATRRPLLFSAILVCCTEVNPQIDAGVPLTSAGGIGEVIIRPCGFCTQRDRCSSPMREAGIIAVPKKSCQVRVAEPPECCMAPEV